MFKKNDEFNLKIESVSNDGNGVGHFDGAAVFVPLTCTGDEITAHIVKDKKTYAYAKSVKILTPSAHRSENDCKVFSRCGGCTFRHIEYEYELEIKKKFVNDAFKRIAKSDLRVQKIIPSPEALRYRNKAQYPIRTENGEIKAGFFSRHSHRIAQCEDCLLQPREFSDILTLFVDFLKREGISAYDEKTGKGLVRHLFLRKAFGSGETAVTIVAGGKEIKNIARFITALTSAFPNVKSVVLNINSGRINTVTGKECITLYGKDYIEDTLLGKRFIISPLSFYQVNHDATEILYSTVKDFADLKNGETILDLYCGIGSVGICITEATNRLIGVEIVDSAVKNAALNARLNNIKNSEFISASAKKATEILKRRTLKADAVIVDPPRKGCERETIESIKNFGASRVVYVSCNPATLARDIEIFKQNGYDAKKAVACDLFPRTPHVETVVLLSQQ